MSSTYDASTRNRSPPQATHSGEYIRLSCELLSSAPPEYFALAERAQSVFREHGAKWLDAFGRPQLHELRFHAGLPSTLGFGQTHKPPIPQVVHAFANAPVTTLRFQRCSLGDAKSVLAVPGVDRIRTLRISLARSAKVGDALARFAWPHLEALNFAENAKWGKRPPREVLASMPQLQTLAVPFEKTDLRGWEGLRALRTLAAYRVPEELLELDGGSLESIAAWDLEFDGTLPAVRHVSAGRGGSWNARSFERFPGLTSLMCSPITRGETSADALGVQSPGWEHLEHLHFGGPEHTVEHLVAHVFPRCARLKSLFVRSAKNLNVGIAHLEALESLEVWLQQFKHYPPCPIDDDAFIRLSQALGPSLRTLKVFGSFSIVGVKALVANPRLRLERVLLSSPHFDAACVRELMKIPTLTHIEVGSGALDDLETLRSERSYGRYLGPSASVLGPQRIPYWSHEP